MVCSHHQCSASRKTGGPRSAEAGSGWVNGRQLRPPSSVSVLLSPEAKAMACRGLSNNRLTGPPVVGKRHHVRPPSDVSHVDEEPDRESNRVTEPWSASPKEMEPTIAAGGGGAVGTAAGLAGAARLECRYTAPATTMASAATPIKAS